MVLLFREPALRLLWGASVVSTLGDFFLGIALPIYVYEQTGSALATGTMFIVATVPRILVGSVAGVFIDRWDRRRAMISADLARALLVLLLLGVRSPQQMWMVYVVAFCQALVGLFFEPARAALLPRLVRPDLLTRANSLDASGRMLARLIGPVLGGVLAAALGLSAVVVIDGASFWVSAALIGRLAVPASLAPPAPDGAAPTARSRWLRTWQDWLAGLRLLVYDRVLASVCAVKGMAMVGEGLINVLWVVFVKESLGGGVREFGWLSSTFGFGALFGSLLLGRLSGSMTPGWFAALGFGATGLLWLLMVNVPWLPLALCVMALNGVVAMGSQIGPQTLLQRQAEDVFRGRVFGALGTTEALMRLVGLVLASSIGDRVGAATMLNTAAGLFLLAGLVALVYLRDVSDNPSPEVLAAAR